MVPTDDAERRRRAHRRAVERSRRGHPVGRELPGQVPPPVLGRLEDVVATGGPLDLLLELSALLDEVAHGPGELDVRWLVQVLVDQETAATTQCLAVLAALVEDDVLRARVRRELRVRLDPLPDWLARLDTLATVSEQSPGGLLVELRLPRGVRPVALLHARTDAEGRVVDGVVLPSGPLSAWPSCGPLLRWAARVAAPGASA
ncbi:hypothetical protein [Arsenicicoccus sp. oral taxon 190]|uniref:hypothetical protein n=1 Tax=Arsenicicoccus sp. oral taxon 190 TaxID=1658671 RepID=UPI00067A2259|nr:hypothetical protein [Arsenicicoccus sp. oral taxon 190]AKT51032.1 hypothetical protein ADJ73_06375 [Arsenicicoccus sp. oral taxon 190]